MSELTLTPAVAKDSQFVYETNSEPAVRANAITPTNIVWEDHVRWFANRLADPKTLLWIVVHSYEPVGVLRFDLDNPRTGTATITIALSPDARDRSVGTRAITAGTREVLKRQDIVRVVAQIRPDNPASLRAFAKAGYANKVGRSVDGVPLIQIEFR